MKPSTAENLHEAVKVWISNDLPPSEKDSLSPALLDKLHERFAAKVEAATEPAPTPPKPTPQPPKPTPKPKHAAKKPMKAKSKKKTRH